MYRKFKIEDSFNRNIFSGSIMDYCLADETLEKVNEHVQKVQVHRLVGQKYVQQSVWTIVWPMYYLKESVSMNRKIKDSSVRNMFNM